MFTILLQMFAKLGKKMVAFIKKRIYSLVNDGNFRTEKIMILNAHRPYQILHNMGFVSSFQTYIHVFE